MAFSSDSLRWRTLGPAIASAAVGIALGVAAIVGSNTAIDDSPAQLDNGLSASDAILGDPEYGSRN
ncbi:DUF2613 domain-containing protein [Corynebacterium sp. ES2794-CONJ1]|uniref:DUF2613 domain-containing protein n=1 Tax=unclassified Corynebacterium TaxID=2624378 RepID=UPI002168AC82|nr:MULTISPECIES: DUF2613 domain-containing protein [unclassified Corynebacterium]MCS4490160.1 DUF2613 domain-containing protein [Corynebacterium sp. ES2775-CONJ]MCS4492028.1 DUF2613 domain-containing protein [Corynebacterium sp. ES2715-CONJ3]MCS4532133.1 DUF2613 domain-containing protein [Corynebacterium sp. ES2730-CONJ]MCU9519535.1 DUF2613 domain-containing protein [Corynebacterium sp. ES2794-CONJ1]